MIVICPYCGAQAERTTAGVIYPHRKDIGHRVFWRCVPCAAWVGCHPGTEMPLGRLANAELREWKRKAHDAFDPLWKARRRKQKKIQRERAYKILARMLKLAPEMCHIGQFDVETCKRVIDLIPQLQKEISP